MGTRSYSRPPIRRCILSIHGRDVLLSRLSSASGEVSIGARRRLFGAAQPRDATDAALGRRRETEGKLMRRPRLRS